MLIPPTRYLHSHCGLTKNRASQPSRAVTKSDHHSPQLHNPSPPPSPSYPCRGGGLRGGLGGLLVRPQRGQQPSVPVPVTRPRCGSASSRPGSWDCWATELPTCWLSNCHHLHATAHRGHTLRITSRQLLGVASRPREHKPTTRKDSGPCHVGLGALTKEDVKGPWFLGTHGGGLRGGQEDAGGMRGGRGEVAAWAYSWLRSVMDEASTEPRREGRPSAFLGV